MANKLHEQHGSVPVPDPTALTIEALKTAIQNLKELVFTKVAAMEKEFSEQIHAVNTLKEEKFKELRERLDMVERHRIEAKSDDASALSAALSAQKELFDQKNKCNEEATAKAEASFTKQIEGIRKEGDIERDGLSGRIDALKERIDRGRGKEEHEEYSTGRSRETSAWLIPMLVIGALALINLALNVITMLSKP